MDPIIVAGFEPFGEHEDNPSVDVARAAGECRGLRAADPLPVEYTAVRRWIDDLFDEGAPTLVVGVGLADEREDVEVELRARNAVSDRPDQAGRSPEGEALVEGSPETLATDVDVRELAGDLERRFEIRSGLPGADWSRDAGRYVCNAFYYHALLAMEGVDGVGTAVFVHVPPMASSQAASVGRKLGSSLRRLVGSRG